MSKARSLTEPAREGYYGNQNKHLATSPNWYAHEFGMYLHNTGRAIPTDVRMGRGDSIRSGDMRFTFEHAGKAVIFTRIE